MHVLDRLRESGVAVPAWLAQLPVAGKYLDLWWRANLSNPEVLTEWLRGVNIENLTTWTGTLGGALMRRLFLFAITLIALSLVLRDGTWLADRSVVTARRLLGSPGTRLIGKIAEATRATVNGTIAAAILRGAVLGIAYVRMGVPHSLLYSVLTIVLALAARRLGRACGGFSDLGFSRRHLVGACRTVCLWRGGAADLRQFHSASSYRRQR